MPLRYFDGCQSATLKKQCNFTCPGLLQVLYFAIGSPTTELADAELRQALAATLEQFGPARRVLAVPPDMTRIHSQAGKLTCLLHQLLGDRLADVLPALGTHDAMNAEELAEMYPTLPTSLVRVHRWRQDVETIGHVPAEFVHQVTEGIYSEAWPAQLNRLVWQGGHDLILSLGQVVPHEVIGMANYNKNLFVGTGGPAGINESHYLSAVYGMERIMGRADNPLRRILNYAHEKFLNHLPIVFVLTVIGRNDAGKLVIRGLFIGDDVECFNRAAELSVAVNFDVLEEAPQKIVVYLDPKEFKTTWLGNKAIYRTRMAVATGGEVVILAPNIGRFGEDKEIDALIRKYGYRTTPEIVQAVADNADLRGNLSAAAHLIHGSSENRFKITYCPGKMTRAEIEGVGYQFDDLTENLKRYDPEKLRPGWQTVDGEQIYYVSNPALGLWAHKSRIPN